MATRSCTSSATPSRAVRPCGASGCCGSRGVRRARARGGACESPALARAGTALAGDRAAHLRVAAARALARGGRTARSGLCPTRCRRARNLARERRGGATPQPRARRELRLRPPLRVRRRRRAAPDPAGAARAGGRLGAVSVLAGRTVVGTDGSRCAITSATCTPAICARLHGCLARALRRRPRRGRAAAHDQAADGRDRARRRRRSRPRWPTPTRCATTRGSPLPARDLLPPPDPAVKHFEAQLLLAPRRDGAITIGDTHAFDAPGAFGSDDEAHAYLEREASCAFGSPPDRPALGGRLPAALRRPRLGLARTVQPGVVAVAGTGGMGVTDPAPRTGDARCPRPLTVSTEPTAARI